MKENDLPVILNSLVEPVLIVNANRQITLANKAAEELFGVELEGHDFVNAVRHPEALKCVETVLAGQVTSETIITLLIPVRATYKISSVRLNGGNEMESVAVISLNDISHVLEAEQMRSDFVANVSHELRSPLTALRGGIETLKGAAKNDPAAQSRFLDIMEREAERMGRLIDDLLSLSKIEVHEHLRPTDSIDVLEILERMIATLKTQSDNDHVQIILKKPNYPCLVVGDDDELTQVFRNLIENAIKYGRTGGEVHILLTQTDNVAGIRGPALVVEFSDQGDGIPPEYIPRLTERFYRIDSNRSREQGGTGLGLAIVKHILNRHRGRLAIRSEIGTGSTFTVNLPI